MAQLQRFVTIWRRIIRAGVTVSPITFHTVESLAMMVGEK